MGYSTRKILIGSSSVLALLLIGSAYATSGPLPFRTSTAGAESTHDILVSYASKDTDADGLPDWQEALYGTDPTNAHSVNPSATDAEAVAQGLVKPKFATATSTPVDTSIIPGVQAGPTTLTDQFSKSLFGQYLKNRGLNQPTPAEIATFVEQGVAQLKQSQATQDAFNQGQVRVSGTGPDALLVYAGDAEKAIYGVKVTATRSEIEYFSDAVNKGDLKGLKQIKSLSDSYSQMAHALMKISVPKETATAHLKLANAYMRMSNSTADLAAFDTDPIRSMLGLAKYQDDLVSLSSSFADLHVVYVAEHVVPSSGTTGSQFYRLTELGDSKK